MFSGNKPLVPDGILPEDADPAGEGEVAPRRAPRGLPLLWLCAAGVLAYATALPGQFVWVDHVEIEQGGYRIVRASDWRDVWSLTLDQYLQRREAAFESQGGYWRPVYALSLTLDWLLWQDRPLFYHIENVGWHLLVVIGLYYLGLRLFGGCPDGPAVVFWATMLFAVHPLGVHSVTWISGRKDTMCAAFAVGALLALARALDRPEDETWISKISKVLWTALATVLTALALGSKELALVVPLVALLLPLVRAGSVSDGLRRTVAYASGSDGGSRGVWLLSLLPLGLVALAVVVYRTFALGGFGLNVGYPSPSPLDNLATFARLAWHFASRVFWPWQPSISDGWEVSSEWGIVEVLAVAGLALALVALAMALYRRWPYAPALAWYALWMLPASGLVPLRHWRAERYLYPASWGLLILGVAGLFAAWRRLAPGRPAPMRWLAVACVVLTMGVTAHENTHWWSDADLFEHAVKQDPAYLEGRVALAQLALEDEDYPEAIRHARQAIADAEEPRRVGYWFPFLAHSILGTGLYHERQLDAAEEAFEQALAHRPNHPSALYHMGLVRFARGDLKEANRYYLAAWKQKPDDFLIRSNLAITLLRLGEARVSVELLIPLVKERPEDLTNRVNLAAALLTLREYGLAEMHLLEVLRHRPDDAVQRAKLAWSQLGLGKVAEARRNQALARKQLPDDATVRYVEKLLERFPPPKR